MLTKKNLCSVWLIGAISGFTLMISGNTLNFWLANEHIDIRTIGIFALISIPYAINFLWAPIFDLKKITFLSYLGHRLSWVSFIQICLGVFIILLSLCNPTNNIIVFGFLNLIVSFLSAAQDTVLGALRTEIIPKESQGEASGIYIFGYRIGMLISSSGAIFLSEFISWNFIYLIFGVIILTCPIILIFVAYLRKNTTTYSNSKKIQNSYLITYDAKDNNKNFLLKIFKALSSIKYLSLIIIFLVLYRLPDNFINIMINPFLLDLGYNARQIATTGKLFGVITAIIGGLIASRIMRKKDILECLFSFGVIHALAHTLFIVQNIYGKELYLLFFVISFESITGGMTMAAYFAFIASLCQGEFRATQYSFLTAMMGLSRSIFPALSGYIVTSFGWNNFFTFTVIATFPSLWLVLILRNKLLKIKA